MKTWISLFILFNISTATFANEFTVDPELYNLVKKIDERNAQVQGMQASFVQRKEISLLKEPLEMAGTFYLDKAKGIRFDFEPEEDLELILTEKEMVALSHNAKKAERIKLKRRRNILTQQLLADKLETLLDYFNIGRSTAANEQGEHFLVLYPTKRKMKKKFRQIQIWVNRDFLINHVRVESKDGDIYELFLKDIQVNPQMRTDLFDTTIPETYQVGDRMDFILGADFGM